MSAPPSSAEPEVDREGAEVGGSRDCVRWRLDVAYDGTHFSGWARQPSRRTVQGTLEDALVTILRLPAAALTVAGRTDAGVHARGQVCHVDLPFQALPGNAISAEQLSRRLGRLLPEDVRVHRIQQAPPGFDARFAATWRRYAYRICDEPSSVDPLTRHTVLAWPRRLDCAAMSRAGDSMVGEHDFAAFCKKRERATTIRALRRVSWTRDVHHEAAQQRLGSILTATLVADAFCHHMVRALVGAMIVVGEGRRRVEWPLEVLRSGIRDPRVLLVPARGLTLEEVGYPSPQDLAARVSRSKAWRTPA
ncbi:MAG: tRNA pseudouridine(38-40) synthase TruA [Nocardioidaceae bacterium]